MKQQEQVRIDMTEQRNSVTLNKTSLSELDAAVRVPVYDQQALQPHIVHLGVGGFHRAHQAVYLDDLLVLSDTERWGEIGVGVLPSDARMRDALRGQDFLFTVVERSASVQSARVIGSMVGYILAAGDREAAIEAMAAASTRIVSLTITEGGYYLDEGTGKFFPEHPEIQRDLAQPEQPRTSIGLIVEALQRRRLRGLPPFTVMSCDNLQENGHVTKQVMLGYAGRRDPALEQWIAEQVTFPNSMVDRITPGTTPDDLDFVATRFGVKDAWPVMTEPFRQWVIEDNFCNGRPAWERVGAELIGDVAPYETMKIRLLNGSHLAMAYLGALAGHTYVHEILADAVLRDFISAFMEEVTPVVPVIPGTSVTDYKQTLLDRFSNPNINDQVTRICSEGSAKVPKWLLPSVTELLSRGVRIPLLTLVVGSWIFYFGQDNDELGKPLQVVDARRAELTQLARRSPLDPRPLLSDRSIFGERLPAMPEFVEGVSQAMAALARDGVHETLRKALTA